MIFPTNYTLEYLKQCTFKELKNIYRYLCDEVGEVKINHFKDDLIKEILRIQEEWRKKLTN